MSKWRTAVKVLVFAAIVAGALLHVGTGTYSSLGLGFVAAVCPLGSLEALFGSWAFVPRLLVAIAVMLVVVFLTGRAFCSWVCPVPPLSRFLGGKKRERAEEHDRVVAARTSLARWRARQAGEAGAGDGAAGPDAEASAIDARVGAAADENDGLKRPALDSRHAVLAGALGSAAVFGFPVFCLVCPVGLTCATIVLLVRLVGFNEPSWGLIVFPLVVILELTVLRKWCSKICPISALMSLVGRFGRTFRPAVDASACLRQVKGEGCIACAASCPERIDPHSDLGEVAAVECVRCGRCADACPVHAISLPFLPPKA